MNGTEHVVVGEEVVKAQVLDRSPEPPNSGRISSKLDLRVDDADLHGLGVCQALLPKAVRTELPTHIWGTCRDRSIRLSCPRIPRLAPLTRAAAPARVDATGVSSSVDGMRVQPLMVQQVTFEDRCARARRVTATVRARLQVAS